MKKTLTSRQREVLSIIEEASLLGNSPPTVREIGSRLGITSTGSVAAALDSLEKKGYIHRRPGSARGVSLAGRRRSTRTVKGTRGVPILPFYPEVEKYWEGSPEGIIQMDRRLTGSRRVAALPLPAGLSFRGLKMGSCYFILERDPLKAGEVYAMLVDGELVAGPVFRGRDWWRLYDILSGEEVIISREDSRRRVFGRVVNMICLFWSGRQAGSL
jgi:repressor LexA